MKILDKITAAIEDLFFGKMNRDNEIQRLKNRIALEQAQQKHLEWKADFYKNLYDHYEKLSTKRFEDSLQLQDKLWAAENELFNLKHNTKDE